MQRTVQQELTVGENVSHFANVCAALITLPGYFGPLIFHYYHDWLFGTSHICRLAA
jgi:hypothetical protein